VKGPFPGRDEILERIQIRGGGTMLLKRADNHITIDVNGRMLMSSYEHASEDALGKALANKLVGVEKPRVLIGGLGLGYTLRAALDALPKNAEVVVAELVPEVVAWQKGPYGTLAHRPVNDPRVEVIVEDVGQLIQHRQNGYDAILLDVDNGPDALVTPTNQRLYTRAGLGRARAALRPNGLLAVWSAFASRTFTHWLVESNFSVKLERPEPATLGGPRYYVWWARKAAPQKSKPKAATKK
jgi:spermidine synthase